MSSYLTFSPLFILEKFLFMEYQHSCLEQPTTGLTDWRAEREGNSSSDAMQGSRLTFVGLCLWQRVISLFPGKSQIADFVHFSFWFYKFLSHVIWKSEFRFIHI